MARKIFVNVCVNDLPKTKAFYAAIGFEFAQQFTSDAAACVVISESIHMMLLTPKHFKKFSPMPAADAKSVKEVLICVTLDSRAEVDELVDKAVAAGATTFEEPTDHGFMYGRSFIDPDGHGFEFMWMDPDFKPDAA